MTERELSDKLDAIDTLVQNLKAQVAAKDTEIAALQTPPVPVVAVTQDQLDALGAKADAILSA